MRALTILPLISACYNPPDFTYNGVPQAPDNQIGEVLGAVADECHAALLDGEVLPFNLGSESVVEPELILEGENLWFWDYYKLDVVLGDSFFEHLGVYAGFDESKSYCYGDVDQSLETKWFDVNINLSDPACGGLESMAVQSELKLYFFHEDQGECTNFFSDFDGNAAVFPYALNVDIADLEAASVVRTD